jgi:hypothetical protein
MIMIKKTYFYFKKKYIIWKIMRDFKKGFKNFKNFNLEKRTSPILKHFQKMHSDNIIVFVTQKSYDVFEVTLRRKPECLKK